MNLKTVYLIPIKLILIIALSGISSLPIYASESAEASESSESGESSDLNGDGMMDFPNSELMSCDLSEGYQSCENNYECKKYTSPMDVDGYEVTVESHQVTFYQKFGSGGTCISNDSCLSGKCNENDEGEKVCSDIGFCGSCVPSGGETAKSADCCEGTLYNQTTMVCDADDIVVKSESEGVGTLDEETCAFEYSDAQKDFIENKLSHYDKHIVAFMYLFSYNKENLKNDQLWVNHGDETKVSGSDKSKVFQNSFDYYPYYSNLSWRGNGEGDGDDRRKDKFEPLKWSSQGKIKGHKKVKGMAEIANHLLETRQTELTSFLEEKNKLLEELEGKRGRFLANSSYDYVDTDVNLEEGGEAGVNYWQTLLDFYTLIQTREISLADSYSTAHKDMKGWAKMYQELGGTDFAADDYKPMPCRDKKQDGDENKFHLKQAENRNCVAEKWRVKTDAEVSAGKIAGAAVVGLLSPGGPIAAIIAAVAVATNQNWMVDPVYKLSGEAINKLREDDGKKKKKGRFYQYDSRKKDFRKIVRKDIKKQLLKCAQGSLVGCEKDNYISEYYNEADPPNKKEDDIKEIRQLVWLYMKGWGGLYSFKKQSSAWEKDSLNGNTLRYDESSSARVQTFGDFFDPNDQDEYEVPFRLEIVQYKDGKTQGGLKAYINELENFYSESVDARQEVIACIVDKMKTLDDGSANDFIGANGATKYENQEGAVQYAQGSVDENCPPSSTDCGANRKDVDSDFNFSLGTKSITGTSSGSGSSLKGLSAVSAKVGSLTSKNAIRKSALKSLQAEQKAAYGDSYGAAAAKGMKTAMINLFPSKIKSKASSTSTASGSSLGNENLLPEDEKASEKGKDVDSSADPSVASLGQSSSGSSKNRRRRRLNKRRRPSSIKSGSDINESSSLSESEVKAMLSGTNDEKYKRRKDDTLFDAIHKRYVRTGYGALLKRKRVSSYQDDQVEDDSMISKGKNGFQPWMMLKQK